MKRGSKINRLLDFYLGIPVLNLLSILRRPRRQPEHVQRIGVICSPALGDTLLFSAVLRDLRLYFSEAHIVHFCMAPNLAAANILAGADERVIIDLTKPAASIRTIRSHKVDLFFDFSSWQRITAIFSLLSGARFAIGFRTRGQYRGRGYDRSVEHSNKQHEIENFRDLLRSLSLPTESEPGVVLQKPQVEPLADESDLVVFHLWASGARSWLREWPENRWIDLAISLKGARTLFVITGAPSDMERMVPFAARMEVAGLRAVPFSGTDGFVSLSRIVRRARLVVSVNTGVMHLAAILGSPTLSLNGPTANHRWGPVGICVMGIGPADGSGGYLNLGFEFEGQPQDVMLRIAVDQAIEAARDLMGKREARWRSIGG